jgi:hypothetical protein
VTTRRLEDLNAELGTLDDIISQGLGELAAALRNRINVRIGIDVGHGRELAFGKANGEWTLIIATDNGEHPLLRRSRDERLEMVEDGHIEKLMETAAEQLSEMVPPRRAAIAKLDNLIKRARSAT